MQLGARTAFMSCQGSPGGAPSCRDWMNKSRGSKPRISLEEVPDTAAHGVPLSAARLSSRSRLSWFDQLHGPVSTKAIADEI